jgi:hypothetical protein
MPNGHDQKPEWREDPLTGLFATVRQIEKRMEDFVTNEEFRPIRMVVYGLVGMILMAVLGAFIAKVISK